MYNASLLVCTLLTGKLNETMYVSVNKQPSTTDAILSNMYKILDNYINEKYESVVYNALVQKFNSNKRALHVLMSTDQEIVYTDFRDLVLGRNKKGIGKNLVGFYLDKIRTNYLETNYSIKDGYVKDGYLYNWIVTKSTYLHLDCGNIEKYLTIDIPSDKLDFYTSVNSVLYKFKNTSDLQVSVPLWFNDLVRSLGINTTKTIGFWNLVTTPLRYLYTEQAKSFDNLVEILVKNEAKLGSEIIEVESVITNNATTDTTLIAIANVYKRLRRLPIVDKSPENLLKCCVAIILHLEPTNDFYSPEEDTPKEKDNTTTTSKKPTLRGKDSYALRIAKDEVAEYKEIIDEFQERKVDALTVYTVYAQQNKQRIINQIQDKARAKSTGGEGVRKILEKSVALPSPNKITKELEKAYQKDKDDNTVLYQQAVAQHTLLTQDLDLSKEDEEEEEDEEDEEEDKDEHDEDDEDEDDEEDEDEEDDVQQPSDDEYGDTPIEQVFKNLKKEKKIKKKQYVVYTYPNIENSVIQQMNKILGKKMKVNIELNIARLLLDYSKFITDYKLNKTIKNRYINFFNLSN